MKKIYAILNLVSIVGIIFWNYYANSAGINGNSVGSLSDEYANLFTPAGYAFSIWGLIFIGLLILGIYVMKIAFDSAASNDVINRIGPWLIIANIGNGLWLWFWLNEMTGVSVLVMLVILISLLTLMVRLGISTSDVSKDIKRMIYWPIACYTGWITVAAVANISAYLAKLNWSWLFDEITWTVIMIIIAAVLYLLVLRTRKSFIFASVGVWAFVAIAVRHWGGISAIQWTAAAAAIMLLANMFVLNGQRH